MKRLICVLFILGLLVPVAMQAGDKAAVDMSDPVKVVEAIFEAARTNNAKLLGGLCDPTGENDGDTKRLCKIASDTGGEGMAELVKYFAKGKVTGKAVITGDRAVVPFLFGPDGKKKEEMNLIKRDGKWYLSSF